MTQKRLIVLADGASVDLDVAEAIRLAARGLLDLDRYSLQIGDTAPEHAESPQHYDTTSTGAGTIRRSTAAFQNAAADRGMDPRPIHDEVSDDD